MALEKAIAIANEFKCDISLLYCHSSLLPVSFPLGGYMAGNIFQETGAEEKMAALLDRYKNSLSDGLTMQGEVQEGNWFDQLKQFIITRRIDLIVIPKNAAGFHTLLNHKLDINTLAKQTNCPVLVVTRQFDIIHLKSIVVPVNDFLPVKKLTAATYIAGRYDAIIHLMGYKKNFHDKDPGDTKWLARAYQLLRDHTRLKIHRSSTYGHNVAYNTLSYAKLVEADLIVINTGKESVLGGWLSRVSGKYLYKESNISVLTIAPLQQ